MSVNRHRTSEGLGRLLVAVYGVFAISATARSIYQLATEAHHAPFAYGLSAVAAVVYCVATYALASDRWSLALAAVVFELLGVLVVGLLSVLDGALFPEATVWSDFGQGYGFVPLVLPFVGMWWLAHTRD